MSSNLPVSPNAISSQASRLPSVDLYGAAHRGLRWAHATVMLRLTVMQPRFEELYSPAELRQLNADLIADISPADKVSFLRVMIPAAHREGRVVLLAPLQAALPPGPFQGLLATLQPTLSEADFEHLVTSLRASS